MADARRSPFHPYAGRFAVHPVMPDAGVPRAELLDQVAQMAAEEDRRGDSGRVSGSIYSGDHEHYAFLAEVFEKFAHANVIQRDMYPSATKMESEIVAMTAELLHGNAVGDDRDCGGTVTSGGTESLLTAMLVYREVGRAKGITAPEVVIPVTGHPAMFKAFQYFGIIPVVAPVFEDGKADVAWMRDHIGPNTVALVGSAGSYPHGVIDPIGELGALALEHDLGLHVDACLGGFILAWAEPCGVPVTPFDFSVPGVSSMSIDTHKYGFGFKGSSVVLFKPHTLRRHHYFVLNGWPGGVYGSPGIAGSRSGGIIASTWAAMLSLGKAGYMAIADDIFTTCTSIKDAVRSHDELRLIGDSVFMAAFRANPDLAEPIDVYHVNDSLMGSGWRLNGAQLPPALHFTLTRPSANPEVAAAFAADLAVAVDYARHPDQPLPRSGAVYGSGGREVDLDSTTAARFDWFDAMYDVGPLD
ncbi:MAG: aspartate aminotransferase family protein [Actinobacteria bacterium]|nr:aspartate aminotransferase family protein [Actinomycetota bacterium]